MSQFPSRNIGTVKTGVAQPQVTTTPATDWARLLGAAKGSTADGINRWAQQASLIDGKVNAVTAMGGKIVSQVNFENDVYAAMIQAAGPDSICRGVSSTLWMRFKEWFGTYQIGNLPWYPAFAAFPGPFAPPMPNIPTPLAAGVYPGIAGLGETSLAEGIRQRVGATGMGMNGANQFVADYVRWFSQKMSIWLPSAMWIGVLGSGPVPTFAPPYVPVGPVVGGAFYGNPGCLSGGRFMV